MGASAVLTVCASSPSQHLYRAGDVGMVDTADEVWFLSGQWMERAVAQP